MSYLFTLFWFQTAVQTRLTNKNKSGVLWANSEKNQYQVYES